MMPGVKQAYRILRAAISLNLCRRVYGINPAVELRGANALYRIDFTRNKLTQGVSTMQLLEDCG